MQTRADAVRPTSLALADCSRSPPAPLQAVDDGITGFRRFWDAGYDRRDDDLERLESEEDPR